MNIARDNRSAATDAAELQERARAVLAEFVDRTVVQGFAAGQVLEAIERAVAGLRQPKSKDSGPAEGRSGLRLANPDEMDEPSNDWPAG